MVLKPLNKDLLKKILLALLFVALVTSNAITLKLYLDSLYPDSTELEQAAGDELSRVKYFIKDWFDELYANYGSVQIYRNELRFQNGTYTLTVAGNRVRAVFPRGTRYFSLQYVTYIEFFDDGENLCCRLYYNETGETVFKLK